MKMKRLYKILVIEISSFYGLLAVILPFVYAVTYELAFTAVFTAEWLAVTLFLYPIVLVLSTVYYGWKRMKKIS